MTNSLQQSAQQILLNNNQGKFTIPCENLYPFQWHWDSGFIALGLAHIDMEKAITEIETLLSSQWENGFIPHIVFHNKVDSYFPNADFHHSALHPEAIKGLKTTGMTQPPVTGFVLKHLYDIAEDKTEIKNFIKSKIDQVYFSHQYLYNNRDPEQEGLVYIYHNWESGTDNSPVWDEVWKHFKNIPKYEFTRKDTTHVDADQRPSDEEYNMYIHIIEVAKKYNYNDQKIAEHSPFLIQDPLFNAILSQSNQALIELYSILDETENLTKIKQLKTWDETTKQAMNTKLFDEELGTYVHYDMRQKTHIRMRTSSSFVPLFAGIPDKQRAEQMLETLETNFGGDNYYLCASFDRNHPKFQPKKYWRGPVWINLNWLLYHGLKRYGFLKMATQVKNDSIDLIQNNGFYEYFDPRKSESNAACGGKNFSWSAALLLDFLNENNT